MRVRCYAGGDRTQPESVIVNLAAISAIELHSGDLAAPTIKLIGGAQYNIERADFMELANALNYRDASRSRT